MPILSQIGRRHWKTRLLVAVMYVLLMAGAVTMVYPFLLMLAGSTKSSVDAADQRVVPAFLRDDAALYRKHIEGLFNESLSQMRWAYDSDAATFQKVEPPGGPSGLVHDWREFLESSDLPAHTFELGYLATPQSRGAVPSSLRNFKLQLERVYGDDITRLNDALGTTYVGWNAFFVLPRNGLERRIKGGDRAFDRAVADYVRKQPLEQRYYFSAEGFFKIAFLKNQYTPDLAAYNLSHGTAYSSWNDVHLSRRVPDMAESSQLERDDWERFVRGILGLVWIRADASATPAYREFLSAKYKDVAALNSRYSTSYSGFDEVPFPGQPPPSGLVRSDWESFLQGWRDPGTGTQYILPAESLVLDTVEFRFQDWLQAKYGTLEEVNSHLGSAINTHHSAISAWSAVLPPQREFHYQAFKSDLHTLRKEFATRNFRSVGDYIFRHGRALVNTALYCGLAVLCALIFNPLAAYALSRYRPRSTYKLLLFLMLTMAFPPMVTQIPVFLMLRQFNLLNTFAALVLPGLANGYTIFLLKGFFDSLPRELYECAQLDGAGEFRLFWQITMRLSTPILAVTALGAFTGAYTNFMMALLLCQDERMWTIMPWLYQLQATSGQGVVFASLMLASIPTLIVFVLCQKVIMRGIVVPVEK
jgi:multiple sugar transport system permease protein